MCCLVFNFLELMMEVREPEFKSVALTAADLFPLCLLRRGTGREINCYPFLVVVREREGMGVEFKKETTDALLKNEKQKDILI